MKICIVGLGLLGGSFSLGLKKVTDEHKYAGVDVNAQHAEDAVRLGLVEKTLAFDEGVKWADMVVLATPVDIIQEQLKSCLDMMTPHQILIDLGSTKESFCAATENHPLRGRYVSCHPIAGTENSGPEAAFATLLKNKMMIICDKLKSDPDALTIIEDIFRSLEMRLTYMSSAEHDRHIAYVSHLSHISSFALGLTVLEKEKDERSIFEMAGSGFSSTVRLAKSSPEMWAPIFVKNKTNIAQALDAYIKQLQIFREAINKENKEDSHELMTRANEIRRVLMGIDR